MARDVKVDACQLCKISYVPLKERTDSNSFCTLVPSCASSNASSLTRRVAYYELFALASRPCDTMEPEAIAAGALTHINLAFILFDDTYKLVDT